MIIRRETLTAALAATTDDDTRYYLSAVQVDPKQKAVIATNGHVLLVCTDRNPQADEDFPSLPEAPFHGDPENPVLVPTSVVLSMLNTMPKKTPIPILRGCQVGRNGSDETATIAATDLQAKNIATLKDDERKFPAYERVLPKADRKSIRVVLGIPVLETLIKAAKAVQVDKKGQGAITFDISIDPKDRAKITTNDPETGEVITVAGEAISQLGITITGPDVTITGACMPCRV
jgi:DNA polymerase III sliding clamp (beta) subunit (PCNA family)